MRAGPRPQVHQKHPQEIKIIELLARQFLTDKSVFGGRFMVELENRVLSDGSESQVHGGKSAAEKFQVLECPLRNEGPIVARALLPQHTLFGYSIVSRRSDRALEAGHVILRHAYQPYRTGADRLQWTATARRTVSKASYPLAVGWLVVGG